MQIVESVKLEMDSEEVISDDWNGKDHGLKVALPVEKQRIGN